MKEKRGEGKGVASDLYETRFYLRTKYGKPSKSQNFDAEEVKKREDETRGG